jgi:hypothetical protein
MAGGWGGVFGTVDIGWLRPLQAITQSRNYTVG